MSKVFAVLSSIGILAFVLAAMFAIATFKIGAQTLNEYAPNYPTAFSVMGALTASSCLEIVVA
jgi:hypothetical protein